MYWTDWETEAIHKANKFDGTNIENVAVSLYSPMDIHVYHELRQPQHASPCAQENGGCSHMCLSSPRLTPRSATYACACPDGIQLNSNGMTCEDNGKWKAIA